MTQFPETKKKCVIEEFESNICLGRGKKDKRSGGNRSSPNVSVNNSNTEKEKKEEKKKGKCTFYEVITQRCNVSEVAKYCRDIMSRKKKKQKKGENNFLNLSKKSHARGIFSVERRKNSVEK